MKNIGNIYVRYNGKLPARHYGESSAGKTLLGFSSLQPKRDVILVQHYAGDSVGASRELIFT